MWHEVQVAAVMLLSISKSLYPIALCSFFLLFRSPNLWASNKPKPYSKVPYTSSTRAQPAKPNGPIAGALRVSNCPINIARYIQFVDLLTPAWRSAARSFVCLQHPTP